MAGSILVGTLAGLLASLLRPLVVQRLLQGRPSPWEGLASDLMGFRAKREKARRAAWMLLLADGAAWGILYGAWDRAYPPLAESYVLQGIVVGGMSFGVAATVIATRDNLRRKIDARLWVGMLLGEVLFGATLGIAFFFWGPF